MTTFTQTATTKVVLAADADRYDSDPATATINTANYGHVTFVIAHGEGATGTVVVTAEECTDSSGTGATAIAFKYRVDNGALTAATTSGFTIAAGSDQKVDVEIDAADLSDGSEFVRLQLTEGVDSPVDSCVIAIASKPRYAEDVLPTA